MTAENANHKYHLAPEISDYNFTNFICMKFTEGTFSYKERKDRPLNLYVFCYQDFTFCLFCFFLYLPTDEYLEPN